MDEAIREALGNEILAELQALSDLEIGSKESQTAVENVTKLYRLGIDEIRADNEYDEKWNRRKMDAKHEESELAKQKREEEVRVKELSEERIHRYVRYGIDVAGIVLPLMFYATWMKKGFKFEETGTYTSTTFRGLFNRFRPTNK